MKNCLNWFQADLNQHLVSLVESQFPNIPLPGEIQIVLACVERVSQLIDTQQPEAVDVAHLCIDQLSHDPKYTPFFKQMILRYRRQQASRTETYREKTSHAGLLQALSADIEKLDEIVATDWFQQIETLRLPRAKDFLPVQYIDQSPTSRIELSPRQYDEKFHILQAPALFLPDLAYFRAKCEIRDAPLSVAFLDIDNFKGFNTAHGETRVDRNLLPGFMQTLEAHVYHHGFAYRQGGDEYLVLLPSLSKELAIAFFDELRCKLAGAKYPDIEGAPTVSIGVCLAEPDCPLTDRELREKANQAKNFAKEAGKNRIATYEGRQLKSNELRIVRPDVID